MKYNFEDAFSDFYSYRNDNLVAKSKSDLKEIWGFHFPEYDGLRFDKEFNMHWKKYSGNCSDIICGYFSCVSGQLKITFRNNEYKVRVIDRYIPALRCTTDYNGSDKQVNYEIYYNYGNDVIVLNSHYTARGGEYLNRILNISIYTNAEGHDLDELVPDCHKSLMNEDIDNEGLDIKNVPSLRVYANRCCDYYHETYDIYEPKRHK